VVDNCSDIYNLHHEVFYFIFYCTGENNIGSLLRLRIGNTLHVNCKGYCFQLHIVNFFHEYFVHNCTQPSDYSRQLQNC
jgi:hypothetical protein